MWSTSSEKKCGATIEHLGIKVTEFKNTINKVCNISNVLGVAHDEQVQQYDVWF